MRQQAKDGGERIMANPFRHRELFTMEDLMSDDWAPAYKAERLVKEDLDSFER